MELFHWGQSMYGGWYIEFRKEDGHFDGKHFNKLNELRAWCKENGLKSEKSLRCDH